MCFSVMSLASLARPNEDAGAGREVFPRAVRCFAGIERGSCTVTLTNCRLFIQMAVREFRVTRHREVISRCLDAKMLRRIFFVQSPVSSAYGPPFLHVRKKLRPWRVSSNGCRAHVRIRGFQPPGDQAPSRGRILLLDR